MSALGQKQTFAVQKGKSALPPKADVTMTGVNKAFRRGLGFHANQLLTLETCDATVPNHVGGTRPDRRLKHRHSNHSADDEIVTG